MYRRLYCITGDNQVWKSLTNHHYGQVRGDLGLNFLLTYECLLQAGSSHLATSLPVYSKVFIQQYNEQKYRYGITMGRHRRYNYVHIF